MVLLDKLQTLEDLDFYAAAAAEHGWSRQVLVHHLATGLRARSGEASSNFAAALPAGESDLAQALTRDPYVLDFLDAAAPLAERELEDRNLSTWLGQLAWSIVESVGGLIQVACGSGAGWGGWCTKRSGWAA